MIRLRTLFPLRIGSALVLAAALAQGQSTILLSTNPSGIPGNSNSNTSSRAVSLNGRLVVFESAASDLVPGDTNSTEDVFVRDRSTGVTTRVSVDSLGTQSDGPSLFPTISPDGRFVAFASEATNLVAGDTNLAGDVFVHDRLTGATVRASVDSLGNEGDGTSGFSTWHVGAPGVFYSGQLAVANGGRVAFVSLATNLVQSDSNGFPDVFVHDLAGGWTVRASVDSAGNQGDGWSGTGYVYPPGSKLATGMCFSFDGRIVAFGSRATNLDPADANGMLNDVFLHDLLSGATVLASLGDAGQAGNGGSEFPELSGDGRFLVFTSVASNLVAGDTNGERDVFRRDLQTGHVLRVSVATGGVEAQGFSYTPAVSFDGRFVAFASYAPNLVPGDANVDLDVFLRDVRLGTTSLVSVASSGLPGNSGSWNPSLWGRGRQVVFTSWASDLVPGDLNAASDVFVRE
jgi:Tol biopolymer transport system component